MKLKMLQKKILLKVCILPCTINLEVNYTLDLLKKKKRKRCIRNLKECILELIMGSLLWSCSASSNIILMTWLS